MTNRELCMQARCYPEHSWPRSANSGHSLRRGFANWASTDGWDTKSLMEYAGWKSVQSAMRYIDSSDRFARYRAHPLLGEETTSTILSIDVDI